MSDDTPHKAERDRLLAAAGAYVDALLPHTSNPELCAKLLIPDRRFFLSCMAGFACQEVTRALEELNR